MKYLPCNLQVDCRPFWKGYRRTIKQIKRAHRELKKLAKAVKEADGP